jgi:hypothetical protein
MKTGIITRGFGDNTIITRGYRGLADVIITAIRRLFGFNNKRKVFEFDNNRKVFIFNNSINIFNFDDNRKIFTFNNERNVF